MSLTFGVLGEVAAEHEGSPIDLGSPQQRAVFGLLLLAGGRPVSTDRLLDQMWGPRIEETRRVTVRTYVTRLRRAFSDAGVTTPVIETLSYGYRLAARGGIDLNVFTEYSARAREARESGDLRVATAMLESALGQWRGIPLTGARGFYVDEERSRLGQIRVEALEDRIELDLRLGRNTALETELLELVTRFPLRERLHEFLMLVLYRSGRQADALTAYQRVRRVLNDELGVAPGPGLSDLQRRILQADPGLLANPSTGRQARPVAVGSGLDRLAARHQLPADTPEFTGRGELVARLTGLLAGEPGSSAVGLCGLAGMGKTTLAVRVAHLVKDRFPDGQFYADVRGGTDRPVPAGEVLGRFLRATGLVDTIPDDVEERAALWRSWLVGRRALVVLDDVTDAEQVQSVVPASAGSAGIVTAVRGFEVPGLAWERVGPLGTGERESLFDAIVGPVARAEEPLVCADLLELTGGYPHGVRAVARRVVVCRDWPLAGILEQIRESVNSPVGIQADSRRIWLAVQRSVGLVDPEVGQALRLLAAMQVARFTAESVAALLATTRRRARAMLDELAEVHLLVGLGGGEFEMITPVRAHARADARRVERRADVRAAVERMSAFYRETETNARFWPEGQTQDRGGLRFPDKAGADRWIVDHEIESRAIRRQSRQFSPAHEPILVPSVDSGVATGVAGTLLLSGGAS